VWVFELIYLFPDKQTLVVSVKLKGKHRKTEKVELKKEKKRKEKADIPAEEQETEEINDEDKDLILAWGEDPGMQWVSEQSMCLLDNFIWRAKKAQTGRIGRSSCLAPKRCRQIGLEKYH
jgi:hypothetical protein